MKATQIYAEEFLTLLIYAADRFTMPTIHKWDESYEGWLYRYGLLRRMQYLEAQKLILREGKRNERVIRITERGRQWVVGRQDPVARWQRPWDGWWRQFIFDLPVGQQGMRVSLLRWLRAQGFGYLQDSVWISPDPVAEVTASLREYREDAAAFTVLECRCAAGFSDRAMVLGAWPFQQIQEKYKVYGGFAAEATKRLRKGRLHPRELFALLREEQIHWNEAFARDPLLPRALWPKGYAGQRTWQLRQDFLRQAAASVTK